MPSRSLRTAAPDVPATREYGAAFLLLLASGVAQRLVTGAVAWVSDRTPVLLDPNLVGTVVYTGLVLTALATVYVAVCRLRQSVDPLEGDELVAVGGTAAFLVGIAAYRVHVVADLPAFPGYVVSSLLQGGVAMGALALGYARLRGIEVPLSLPDRDARPVLGAAVLTGSFAGLAWVVALVLTSSLISHVASADPVFSGYLVAGRPSVGSLLLNGVLPAVFVGFGTALVYNGAVQGGLRERAGRPAALAAVTALVGTFQWTLGPIERLTGVTAPVVLTAGAAAVSVVVAALAARAVRALRRSYGVAVTPALAATAGLLAVVGPLAVLAVALSYPVPGLAYVCAFTAVAAVAAVGYERSRSAWVPAAAFAAFLAVANRDVALLLAQFVG